MAPSSGSTAGSIVVITGRGFQYGVTVTFDGIAAPVAGINSTGTTITVTAPAHAPGRVDVVVADPESGRNGRLASAYNYVGLSVTSIDRTTGFAGLDVRVTGTGFAPSSIVTFGGVQAFVRTANFAALTVIIPVRATPERVDVTVGNPGGDQVTLRDAFTYEVVGLTVDPVSVAPLGQIDVSWMISRGSKFDAIGLFRPADLVLGPYPSTDGATSGTMRFTAPSVPGEYEFRYLFAGDFDYYVVARAPLTVLPGLFAAFR